jgi:hypothetical protein
LLIEGGFRRGQDDYQALLDRGYDAGGHLWGGVAVVGPDGAARCRPERPLVWWPINSSTTWAGMPASSSQVEKVWRKSCLGLNRRASQHVRVDSVSEQAGPVTHRQVRDVVVRSARFAM